MFVYKYLKLAGAPPLAWMFGLGFFGILLAGELLKASQVTSETKMATRKPSEASLPEPQKSVKSIPPTP